MKKTKLFGFLGAFILIASLLFSFIGINSPVFADNGNEKEQKALIVDNVDLCRKDTAFMYSVLRNQYNFSDEDIFLLVADGTDSEGIIPQELIDGSATEENFHLVLNELSQELNENDLLLIWITAHGSWIPGTEEHNIQLFDDGGPGHILWDYEFAEYLAPIEAGEIVIVLQCCYDGGFILELSALDRIVITSTPPMKQETVIEWDAFSLRV